MALSMRRTFFLKPFSNSSNLSLTCSTLRLLHVGELYTCDRTSMNSVKGTSSTVLLRNLDSALKSHQIHKAWESYCDYRKLHGFPDFTVMNRFLLEISYTCNTHWLQKAYDVVNALIKERKPNLLEPHLLKKLCLSFARAQMPISSTMVLRLMLERHNLSHINILKLIFMHMVKTEVGTSLASNSLILICESIHLSNQKPIKPDTMMFNIILDACAVHGLPLKGKQIIELMAQMGIAADAYSINLIARIHELNYQRDELKKFKYHVDQVSGTFLLRHYNQFYDSLLNLHLKFNDVDSSSQLVSDMYECKRCNLSDSKGTRFVAMGSHNMKGGLKLQLSPELMQKDTILVSEHKEELFSFKSGKLTLTDKGMAKLILLYKKCGNISELSKFITVICMKLSSSEAETFGGKVIDALAQLGWLETAHDILDDMETAGVPLGQDSYVSVLRAYYDRKMLREADGLLRQIRRSDRLMKFPDGSGIISCLTQLENEIRMQKSSDLAEALVLEMKEEENDLPSIVHELNSSIYFFWKAKMVSDATKTYQRMQEMGIRPTLQTYANMVNGYSSCEMYREITIIWGDIKRSKENRNVVTSKDLLELLILNFIRGGYFERVMEIVEVMKEHEMHADKWLCKNEFLKFHKSLYRSLNVRNATTEAQSNRIELVRAFRKWVSN
ncbi:pentatricopeptide repeat-containing protein At4g17616 [Impatiens glandulifera]|uniref:pentatricopeptide repeat-containing protein At4g17616 n=1 Tax=Impatiens glandulifera TaxID=253017 RepID=UPI001FB19710|nr:pentatricopeptide repeat-containing protein At4g17616 [Impatiens glandulifera]